MSLLSALLSSISAAVSRDGTAKHQSGGVDCTPVTRQKSPEQALLGDAVLQRAHSHVPPSTK